MSNEQERIIHRQAILLLTWGKQTLSLRMERVVAKAVGFQRVASRPVITKTHQAEAGH